MVTPERFADLIDMITALEALYSDGTQELAYKVALRATIMTEDELSKRAQTFRILKKAYAERSKVIHGTKVPTSYIIEYGEYVAKLLDTLKLSFLRQIELYAKGMTKDRIIEMLDNMALGATAK
jgi:hypothetical protein